LTKLEYLEMSMKN